MGDIIPGAVSNELLAVVSHDLRNPLSTIWAGAELLADDSQTGDQRREVLGIIRRCAQRMDRLVADLLDVSSLAAGRSLRIEPRPLDIVALVAEAGGALRTQAAPLGQEVQLDVPAEPAMVRADADRVLQVLGNLTGNAAKFTPRGGRITLAVRRRAAGEAEVSVADTGPGLSPEEAERVFDPFWQAERTARLGTGLGLKIARAIVEAHGGAIGVESTPGRGTAFRFTLPLEAGA